MKKRQIVIYVLLVLFSFHLEAKKSSISAHKGILDLRTLKNPEHFVINLNGEWEFYWKKLLHPFDFTTGEHKPDLYGKVPSYWTDYKGPVTTERFGFATYRLKILFPKGFNMPLAIDLPVFDSSYDIYLNGKYYGGNGTPGKSAEETKPEYRRNFFRINQASDSLEIIINVANYHHGRGGFWLPVKIGTFNEVQKQLSAIWAAEWSVVSLLLGFSVFFLLFYVLNPVEKLLGAFSLATIGLALRPLFTSHFLILNLIDLSWIWIVRFEYLLLYMLIIGWSWFAVNLYPSLFAKILAWVNTILFCMFAFLTLFLPVYLFSYSTVVYYPMIILLITYLLVQSFMGLKKKKRIGHYLFSGVYPAYDRWVA